jgi:hypothetical protein
MHEAFERPFSKLQNSGLANFANVNNCSFRLSTAPLMLLLLLRWLKSKTFRDGSQAKWAGIVLSQLCCWLYFSAGR